jgi:hypothetical protein
MAALSAWKASDEEILPDYWQVPEYRRRSNRGSLSFAQSSLLPQILIPARLVFPLHSID